MTSKPKPLRDQSVAHFWPADQYRTLEKLSEQGFVRGQGRDPGHRPNRKIYSITEAGKAELHHWLLKPQLPIHREPFLVQLFFGDQLRNAELIAQIDAQLAQHQQQLAVYEKIEFPNTADCGPGQVRSLILNRMTLDMGMRLEKMYID